MAGITKELKKTGMTVTADTGDNSFGVKKVEAWSRLSLELPNFDWAEKFVEFIDETKKLLDVIVSILEAALSFYSLLVSDFYINLIKKVIEELKKMIEGFLDDLGLYLLFVPVKKRFMTNFLGLGDVAPQIGPLFQTNTLAMEEMEKDPDKKQFYTDLNRYSGGNYGFYSTVLQSLYDKGDIHRPQFDNKDDYVGGMVWVMGTAMDPFGFLDDLWKLFGLFGNLAKNTVSAVEPLPTGLTARAIAYPTDSKKKASFLLEWEIPPMPIVTLPQLGGVKYYPYRYALIMVKNNVSAISSQNVIQLFGTRDLKEGLTAKGGDIVVIKEGQYNPTKAAYVVKDVTATKNDSFTFFMAWRCVMYDNTDQDWKEYLTSKGKRVELQYWGLSNAAYVIPYPTLPKSTPPDWIRTPSFAEIFPEFGYLLRRLTAQIEKLLDRCIVPGDLLKQFIDLLKAEIARYAALVEAILEQIKRIAELLNLPKAVGGIYCRKFFGQGGNEFFMSDLAQSLMPSYPNAPPFTRGDEYVAGVVWLCGGPRALVEGTMALLDLFFPNAASKEDMLMSLGGGIAGLESMYFGDDIQSGTEPESFDESLCRISKGSPADKSEGALDILFGDDFLPEGAKSPDYEKPTWNFEW
jgi:hypothetical protein